MTVLVGFLSIALLLSLAALYRQEGQRVAAE